MCFLSIFTLEFEKDYHYFPNQGPQISPVANFDAKKFLNLVPKMPYMGIFGLELGKVTVTFEINTPKFF